MHAQLYGGAHVLLLKDNKVFLLRRAETGYKDGYYTTPAGGIEKGEMFR